VETLHSRSLWHPAATLPLCLIVGPYFLNKLVYIAAPGFAVFDLTDYANRIATLAVLYLVARRGAGALPIPWRLAWPSRGELVLALAGAAVLVLVDVVTASAVAWLNDHSWRLTRYPEASNPLVGYVDNTVGMLLVGFSEEAVFRFYLINALLLRQLARLPALVVATLVFAAIHWSYGAGAVGFAALAGALLTVAYLATRNLTVPVLVHALYDSVYFLGGVDALRRVLLF
jgi:membrane protease YdiL (CAAX protease family)